MTTWVRRSRERNLKGFTMTREAVVGQGAGAFQRAVTGLKTWKAHRLPGMQVFPHDQEIRSGVTVVLTLGTPIASIAAPCRIVGVIDGQTRWGFAYGTLPGHPEQGEESFAVSMSLTARCPSRSRPSRAPVINSSGCRDIHARSPTQAACPCSGQFPLPVASRWPGSNVVRMCS